MHERAEILTGFLGVDEELEREFECRLTESSRLAFRVAYSVLRHRQDAEDVAQDAFVRAHRSFHQLRDRERFRAWLVRTTWRLAIDHLRSSKRRVIREQLHASSSAGSTDDIAAASERASQLWAAIDALPEKPASSLCLRPWTDTTCTTSPRCLACQKAP